MDVLVGTLASALGLIPWALVLWVVRTKVDVPAEHLAYTWGLSSWQRNAMLTSDVSDGADFDNTPTPAIEAFLGPRSVKFLPPRRHALLPSPAAALSVELRGLPDHDGIAANIRCEATVRLKPSRDGAQRAAGILLATERGKRDAILSTILRAGIRERWLELRLVYLEHDSKGVVDTLQRGFENDLHPFGLEVTALSVEAEPTVSSAGSG